MVRLRYKLVWARTRFRDGRIALFVAGCLLLALLAILLVAGGLGAGVRKVVILPPQVAFSKAGTRGSENKIPEAGQIGLSFYSALSRQLTLRGVKVLPNPLGQARDDATKYAVADLQLKYDNVAVQLRRKPGRVEKGRFTLGDRVARFDLAASADALVFARGSGRILTPGHVALAFATSLWFGVTPLFRGEVAIVDSSTGEVLAFATFVREDNMLEKTDERFADSLRKVLHGVPLPVPPPDKKVTAPGS